MNRITQEFGQRLPGVNYLPRPGGYAIIFNRDGDVEVVKNPGSQEPGDTPEQAAVRQVMEECGLQIRISRVIGRADQFVFSREEATGWQKCSTFFLAEADEQRIGAGEADRVLCWVKPRDAALNRAHESQTWAVTEACRIMNR